MQMQIFDAAIIAILSVVLPIFSVWEHRRLQARVARGDPNARTRSYWLGLFTQWPLSIVLFVLWQQSGRSLPELGLGVHVHVGTWIGWGVALALVAALIVQTIFMLRNPAKLEAVREQLEPLRALIPTDSRESRLFYSLSITAGICEEFLYRGYLIAVFGAMFNVWVGILLASLAFGLGHTYQGSRGIVKTGVVGLAMAGLYQLSGSLWAPMLAHAALDINSGYLGRRALAVDEPEPNVRAVA